MRKLGAFNPDQLAKFPVLSLPSGLRTGEVTAKRTRTFPEVFLLYNTDKSNFITMKSKYFYPLAALSLLPVFTGCSNDDTDRDLVPGGNEVAVTFAANLVNNPASRSAFDQSGNNNLTILAYRKSGDNYVFAKAASATSQATDNRISWSSPTFKLEIGTYRFLAFYNLSATLQLAYSQDTAEKTWDEVLEAVKITNTDQTNLDINEIFAGGSRDSNEENNSSMRIAEDIDLSESQSENSVSVTLNLSRVNSRIDMRFLKFSPTSAEGGSDTEQAYTSDNMNIFGATGNLVSISTTTRPASSWTWGTAIAGAFSSDLTFTTPQLGNVTLGTGSATDFPDQEGDQALMDAVPAGRIAKGAAYYKGAYILPFAAADATSSLNLTVKLTGKGDDGSEDASGSLAQERILTVSGVKAEENKVTVVTFKYRASSDSPNDEENVFTPSIKYTVTIQTQWNGIVEGPSVDI